MPPDAQPSPKTDPSGIELTEPPATGQRIELTCPECGHLQREPSRVVSTQCRVCRVHYQVHDGRAVARLLPRARFAKPGANDAAAAPPPAVRAPIMPLRRIPPPPPSWWQRFFFGRQPPRPVHCLECAHVFSTSHEAESTQCPKCGTYASLRDHEIREPWNRRLATRGKITIHKEGAINQTSIHCHDLVVHGKLAAEVHCTGTLDIHSSGKITGPIHCETLRIRSKAHVEFLEPVHAATMLVEGTARGCFICQRDATLAKRAHVFGLIRASGMVKHRNARHVGTLDLIESPTSPARTLAQPPQRD